MHEVGHGSGIESKALLRDQGDKTCAGFEVGIVELSIALVALEVGGVCRREERALVMVEPPRDPGGTGVFEIDDGILVSVEIGFVEERSGAMQEAGEDEVGVFANALAIEAREQGGGASSVEALVVVEDSDFQSVPQLYKVSSRRKASIQRI